MNILYLFNNKDEYLYTITNYDNTSYKRKIPIEWSFSFDIESNDNKDIKKGAKIGFYDRHNIFRLFIISNIIEDFDINTNRVICINDFLGLDQDIIEDRRVNNGTCLQALTKVLEGSRYQVGKVEPQDIITTNFYFISRLEGLNKILKFYGAEADPRIEFDNNTITNKYLDIVFSIGNETGIRCTYDTNLTSLKRETLEEGHFTVLYGQGSSLETENGGHTRKLTFEDVVWTSPKDPTDKPLGQKYIEDKAAIEKYGRIVGIYADDKVTDTTELIQKTWYSLQQSKEPKISYSGTIEDIKDMPGFEHYDIKIGDSIILLNEDLDITVYARLIDEEYSLEDSEIKIVLGNFSTGLTDQTDEDFIKDVIDNVIGDIDTSVDEDNFPSTLPQVPIVTGLGLLSSISLQWTYENKMYYKYEVYASQTQGFAPNFTHLIFKGQASSLIHEVAPKETWYYKVRAVNTHGMYTDFSEEISISTSKISDGATWIEEGAIGDALIGKLRLDRGWVGQLEATYLDVKGKFTVLDGNNDKTLYIDSFGNVHINATNFSLKGKTIASLIGDEVDWAIDMLSQRDIFDKLTNGGSNHGIYLQNGRIYINASYIASGEISVNMLSSNNSNPIIKLFPQSDGSYCSLDATQQYEQGKGSAIRLKWDSMNYILVKRKGVDFYLEPAEVGASFSFLADHSSATISTKYGSLNMQTDGLYYKGSKIGSTKWDDITGKPSSYPPSSHTHNYASSSHNHSGETIYPRYVQPYALGEYGGSTILMHVSLDGNGKNLGWSQSRFQQVSASYGWFDNMYSSRSINNPVRSINEDAKDYLSLFDDVIIETPSQVLKNGNSDLLININSIQVNKHKDLLIGTDDVEEGININNLLYLSILKIQELEQRLQKVEKKTMIQKATDLFKRTFTRKG